MQTWNLFSAFGVHWEGKDFYLDSMNSCVIQIVEFIYIRWRNQNIFFVPAAWLIRAGASIATYIWSCFELQAATTCSCASTALKNASQQKMLGCHRHRKPIQCGRWGNCMAPWNSSKLRHRKYQWSSLHFLASCTHADTCCSTSWFSKVRSILASTENKKLSVCTTAKWI